MASENYVISDVDENIYQEEFCVSAESGLDIGGSANWSVSKRTLRGGTSDGVNVIEVNNGALSTSLLPTRGMGIWRGDYNGIPLGWDSPVKRPVNPAFVDLQERSGLGWLNGFNELLCRCGLVSNGAPGRDVVVDNNGNQMKTDLTLHGKIANIPAWRTEVTVSDEDGGTLAATGLVDETMMFGPALRLKSTLKTTIGSNSFTIIDTVTNLADQPNEIQLLYHTNIGQPILGEGTRFVAPIGDLAPRDARASEGIDSYARYSGPVTGYVEQVYFARLLNDSNGRTTVLLKNANSDRGLSIEFSLSQLPCFSLWKNSQAINDGYVTGLEPATNYPNLKTFEREQGRVVTLDPSETATYELTISVLDSAPQVDAVETRISEIQKQSEAVIHAQPNEMFSPI